MHDLVCVLSAPVQAWSEADGSMRGIGAQGAYLGDTRIASHLALEVEGAELSAPPVQVRSAREAVFAEVVAEMGAEFVHPYNDPRVIAGQATCSAELIEDVPDLDIVIAPIGGGGMISGTCLTLSNLAPQVKIYAAEPEQADDAARSFHAGHIIADDAPNTVADGLKVPLKDLTWHFVQNHVTDILTASEQEIVDAMKLIWKRMKLVMEPSSAVPLAVILKNPEIFAGKRVGVIITGGNVDLDKLPWMEGATK